METILIQLTHNKAYRLLRDLEELKVIKVLKKHIKEEAKPPQESSTAKFRGSLNLTAEQYRDFQQHAKDIRNEWHNDI
ncbi:hypothetical protein [Compostibacter hankyongensis]|uniref:Uncharacterized protein n=1 Tax=Compostibacter hankyongensis TaxID=1007089 RepID=A0ABP8FCE4_9BACT